MLRTQRPFALAIVMISAMLLGHFMTFSPAFAANRQSQVVPAMPRDSAGHVTIMVLDMSGSMAQNDPNGLRCSAADAYINLSGPGDVIGVVGLDNNNLVAGGSHNFLLAQKWADPVDMSTLAARQNLQATIAAKSNNCKPDIDTPTYDALSQAYAMLQQATKGTQKTGSVILLTDGTPFPDTDAQMAAIQSDLIPEYRSSGWAIDTIALGTDSGGFHPFLEGIANGTSGSFYDDSKGDIPGAPNPLNLGPFFVQIFGKHHPEDTIKQDVAPTTVSGQTFSTNFSVTDYTQNLDIIVLKDGAGMTATLNTPTGLLISPGTGNTGNVQVFTESYYSIYIIAAPQAGQWQLNVAGTGNFIMYSSKRSLVGLAFADTTTRNAFVALGAPLTFAAALTNAGHPITDDAFQVFGTIAFAGGSGQYSQDFAFADKANPGTFIGNVEVPFTAPTGTYTITLRASGDGSTGDVVATAVLTIRIELFPLPEFYRNQDPNADPSKGQPTTDPVNESIISWDPVLQAIYNIPFGPIQWLGNRALQNRPARPIANLVGGVYIGEQPYSKAQVTGTAVNQSSKQSELITFVNDGSGHFHILFPATHSALYALNLTTTGTFGDSHGDLFTIPRQANLTVQQAPMRLELVAWAWTILYLLILAYLVFLARNRITPGPYGNWTYSTVMASTFDLDQSGASDFTRAHRPIWQRFFQRNVIFSHQAKLPGGLKFTFHYDKTITITPHGSMAHRWIKEDGSAITQVSSPRIVLRYADQISGDPDDQEGDDQPGVYTISNGEASPQPGDDDSAFGGYSLADDYQSSATGGRKPKRGKRGRPKVSVESSSYPEDTGGSSLFS
jgi:hypothetical protein